MKKKLSLLLCLCLIICSFSFSVKADDGMSSIADINENSPSYIEGEVIVVTNVYYDENDFVGSDSYNFNGISITDIEPLFYIDSQEELAEWIDSCGYYFPYKIQLGDSWNVATAIPILASNDNIISVFENYYIIEDPVSELESSIIDSSIQNSINSTESEFENNLQTYYGIDSIWSKGFEGSDDVVVAVLDSGFQPRSELNENVDWSLARDVHNETSTITASDHGNSTISIIGAYQVNGLCKNVKIIPIRVECSACYIKAVNYASDHDVDILSVSMGMSGNTAEVVSKIENENMLMVTSAGNRGENIDNIDMSVKIWDDVDGDGIEEEVWHPSRGKKHNSPNWIIVGSVNANETIASHSNYGAEYCDIFALGVNVWMVGIDGLRKASGTSYSAPQVTAACALIMSKATHLTPLEVKALLMDNVKEVESLENLCVSGGVLSISNAVGALFSEPRAAYEKGDVSGDGQITATDYMMCKQVVFSSIDYTDEQFDAADVNFDGNVTAVDYMMLQKFIYGTYYFPPR